MSIGGAWQSVLHFQERDRFLRHRQLCSFQGKPYFAFISLRFAKIAVLIIVETMRNTNAVTAETAIASGRSVRALESRFRVTTSNSAIAAHVPNKTARVSKGISAMMISRNTALDDLPKRRTPRIVKFILRKFRNKTVRK